jgi:hypothetical protein
MPLYLFILGLLTLAYSLYLHRVWDKIRGQMQLSESRAAQEAIIAAAWKSYALGYEVFCEASYEGDTEGVLNAGTEIAKARAQLQAIGQYDA